MSGATNTLPPEPPRVGGGVRLRMHLTVSETPAGFRLADDLDVLVLARTPASEALVARLRSGLPARTEEWSPGWLPVLRELARLGWLTRAAPPEAASPAVARNLGVLDAWADERVGAARLFDAHVGVLGVGGLGSEVARHLAAAGVRRFTLVDDDLVAAPDRNRQTLYWGRPEGTPKVDAAREVLAALDPTIRCAVARARVHAAADLAVFAGVDLLVQAADTPVGQLDGVVAGWCESTGTPFIVGSVGIDRGYWGPLVVPGRTPPWADLDPWADAGPATAAGTPWSLGATNAWVAAAMARDVIAWLVGDPRVPTLGRRGVIDFRTGATRFSGAPSGERAADGRPQGVPERPGP